MIVKITIYTDNTSASASLKKYLKEASLEYEEFNCVLRPEKIKEVIRKSGQSDLPVAVIKKKQDDDRSVTNILIGFDQAKFSVII